MDTFFALGEPTRRSIIELLASNGKLSASAIYANYSVSHPAISQHLKVLKDAHLVSVEKRAQQRLYAINAEALGEIEDWVKKMTHLWDDRFARLDLLLQMEKDRKLTKKRAA